MRKFFLYLSITGIVSVVFESCSKESPSAAVSPLHTNVINVTVAPNATYLLQIDKTGSISKQASHFKVSQTEIDDKTNAVVYKYMPREGFSGNDEVILSTVKTYTIATSGCSSSRINTNDNTSYNVTFTTIKFNVTN